MTSFSGLLSPLIYPAYRALSAVTCSVVTGALVLQTLQVFQN